VCPNQKWTEKCPKEVPVMLPHKFLKKKVPKQSPKLSLPQKKKSNKVPKQSPSSVNPKKKSKKSPKTLKFLAAWKKVKIFPKVCPQVWPNTKKVKKKQKKKKKIDSHPLFSPPIPNFQF